MTAGWDLFSKGFVWGFAEGYLGIEGSLRSAEEFRSRVGDLTPEAQTKFVLGLNQSLERAEVRSEWGEYHDEVIAGVRKALASAPELPVGLVGKASADGHPPPTPSDQRSGAR